ncbi:MAG TPA: hypothetical protein VGK15_03935 [Candidatus Limnocylindria bacterium]
MPEQLVGDIQSPECEALGGRQTALDKPVVEIPIAERGSIRDAPDPRAPRSYAHVGSSNAREKRLDELAVIAVKEDVPAVAREAAIRRDEANCVSHFLTPRH